MGNGDGRLLGWSVGCGRDLVGMKRDGQLDEGGGSLSDGVYTSPNY